MKYGYNLYSAFSVTKDQESLISTMRELKRMGYDGVELFLYFDIPAEEMKSICEEIGLVPFSSHPRLFRFFQNLDEELEYAQKAGIETLVMPHVAQEERNKAYYQTAIRTTKFINTKIQIHCYRSYSQHCRTICKQH